MTRTFLSARWENILMANYGVSPALLEPYMPKGVEPDLFNHKVYVSLVGFMFRQTRLFHIPVPLLGTFEEINLRFYVKRAVGNTLKRGVVFINETVPYKPVAWLANKLYKEHYSAVPTKSLVTHSKTSKTIRYEWKANERWNHLEASTALECEQMSPGSMEEFIFEHYYGYTRMTPQSTQEYQVHHPRWRVNPVIGSSIHCDFASMYGKDFSFLGDLQPESVIMAEGSPVTVDWKRIAF